jgi:hypothetical protein
MLTICKEGCTNSCLAAAKKLPGAEGCQRVIEIIFDFPDFQQLLYISHKPSSDLILRILQVLPGLLHW